MQNLLDVWKDPAVLDLEDYDADDMYRFRKSTDCSTHSPRPC